MTANTGLAEYLDRKAAAIDEARRRKPDAAAWRRPVKVEAFVDDLSGVRKIQIREWRLFSTGGALVGDLDFGPTSPENFSAAIASCLTQEVMIRAARSRVALDAVRVTIRGQFSEAALFSIASDDPYGLSRSTLRVDLRGPDDLTPAVKHALVDHAADSCELLRLLREPVELTIELDDTSAEPYAADLGAYLRHKRQALADLTTARPNAEDWRDPVEAETVADTASGVRRVRVREWHSIHDGDADVGDSGLGIEPTELFLGSIASCLTHLVLLIAAQSGDDLQGVHTTVSADGSDAAHVDSPDEAQRLLDIRVRVRIDATEMSSAQRQVLLDKAVSFCGLVQTLRRKNDVVIGQV